MSDKALCSVCGHPMSEGETMFKYHGFSGPCPGPPLQKPIRDRRDLMPTTMEFIATHKHYKGGLYQKIGEGKWEENLTPVVIYRNKDGEVWVRPKTSFEGSLDENGYIPRFEELK